MRLTSFSVENYRAFSRRQAVEIRPLTLFFGWNSGGKSALVRFLPLLAESLRISALPIWLAGEVGQKATWADLVCKSTQSTHLRFALGWRSVPLQADWTIQGKLDGGWQHVRSLSITDGASQQSFTLQEREEEGCRGLLPHPPLDEREEAPIQALKKGLDQLTAQVQWISGVRVRPPRIALSNGTALPMLCPDGRDVVDHLVKAQMRSTQDPLLETTRHFFHALGEQLSLDNPIDDVWRLLLSPVAASHIQVNLCDAGEGYTQVLPILVALAAARLGGPNLLCLEQPELHLHTHAQAILANLLVESALAQTEPTILVETHSEVLLMSVQLAIAKGEITPDKVRVYWVEARPDGTSDAKPIDFDAHGQPTTTTLMGAFDEAVRIGQELMKRYIVSRKSA